MSDFIPRLINQEAKVFRGCTFRELSIMAITGFVVGLPLMGFVGIATGALPLTVGSLAIWDGAWIWFWSGRLEELKSQRPPFYYAQWIARFLNQSLGVKNGLINAHGYMEVRRTR